jgi:hypothetical protein
VEVKYTGPTLNFNGDEFVPRSAIPELIDTAAQRGARMGQQRTMSELKNNPGARRSIGV